MKILFIENRNKTIFFDAVAKHLAKEGHEIYWIIQNHLFLPATGSKNAIPYPRTTDLLSVDKINNEELISIIASDRQLNHFSFKSENHFYYYDAKISGLLDEISPEVVFGESTAFHELITIHNCKKKNILYLNPSSCRYPTSRFSFYMYDTLEPYKGSLEVLPFKTALEVVESINSRTSVPNYMVKRQRTLKSKIKNKARLLSGYYMGDKYNTPSPIIKYRKERKKKENIRKWDEKAEAYLTNDDKLKILYPLQLQPEANIDVWGRKHRNQLEVIKALLHHTSDDCNIYVKPNPKSKYEITDELIAFVNDEKRVIPLKHEVKMGDIFSKLDLVVTVTGTIAIECILSNKPVLTLVKTLNNSNKNCPYLENFSDLGGYIDLIKKEKFPQLSTEEKIDFINLLNSKSYAGIVSDPFSNSFSIRHENIDKIVRAFRDVLNTINVL